MHKKRFFATKSDELSIHMFGEGGYIERVNLSKDQFEKLQQYYKPSFEEEAKKYADEMVESRKKQYKENHKKWKNDKGSPSYSYFGSNPEPIEPDYEKVYKESVLYSKAIMSRDFLRDAETDGARLIAYLSQYLQNNEDPVTLVAMGMTSLGFDTSDELYEPINDIDY